MIGELMFRNRGEGDLEGAVKGAHRWKAALATVVAGGALAAALTAPGIQNALFQSPKAPSIYIQQSKSLALDFIVTDVRNATHDPQLATYLQIASIQGNLSTAKMEKAAADVVGIFERDTPKHGKLSLSALRRDDTKGVGVIDSAAGILAAPTTSSNAISRAYPDIKDLDVNTIFLFGYTNSRIANVYFADMLYNHVDDNVPNNTSYIGPPGSIANLVSIAARSTTGLQRGTRVSQAIGDNTPAVIKLIGDIAYLDSHGLYQESTYKITSTSLTSTFTTTQSNSQYGTSKYKEILTYTSTSASAKSILDQAGSNIHWNTEKHREGIPIGIAAAGVIITNIFFAGRRAYRAYRIWDSENYELDEQYVKEDQKVHA